MTGGALTATMGQLGLVISLGSRVMELQSIRACNEASEMLTATVPHTVQGYRGGERSLVEDLVELRSRPLACLPVAGLGLIMAKKGAEWTVKVQALGQNVFNWRELEEKPRGANSLDLPRKGAARFLEMLRQGEADRTQVSWSRAQSGAMDMCSELMAPACLASVLTPSDGTG